MESSVLTSSRRRDVVEPSAVRIVRAGAGIARPGPPVRPSRQRHVGPVMVGILHHDRGPDGRHPRRHGRGRLRARGAARDRKRRGALLRVRRDLPRAHLQCRGVRGDRTRGMGSRLPWGWTEEQFDSWIDKEQRESRSPGFVRELAANQSPSLVADEAYLLALGKVLRLSASPGEAAARDRAVSDWDVRTSFRPSKRPRWCSTGPVTSWNPSGKADTSPSMSPGRSCSSSREKTTASRWMTSSHTSDASWNRYERSGRVRPHPRHRAVRRHRRLNGASRRDRRRTDEGPASRPNRSSERRSPPRTQSRPWGRVPRDLRRPGPGRALRQANRPGRSTAGRRGSRWVAYRRQTARSASG